MIGAGTHPLGPLLVIRRLERPVVGRLYAAGLAASLVGVAVAAHRLVPDHRQIGTHRQLGLPPCGFVLMTGYPCPTCGMTTAFACVVRGELGSAFRAQAAGAGLAVVVLVVAVAAVAGAVTGRYPGINWYRVDPVRLTGWATLAFVLAWGLKVALGLMDGTIPVRRAW